MSAAAPPPPAAPAAPADPWAWLDALPAAVLQVDGDDRVIAANAAARTMLGALAEPGTDLRSSIGLPAGEPPDDPVRLPGGGWVTLRRSLAGAAVRLVQVDDAAALAEASRSSARDRAVLELAQQVGRIGIWERDLRTLGGRWDRQIHRFWGVAEDRVVPDFDAASAQVVDDDRAGMRDAFRRSMERPGLYAHRYRVRRPDGTVVHLHSHWTVQFDADGRPERARGIIVDDTEVVAVARERAEVQSQLSLAADLAGLMLMRRDMRTRRYHFNGVGWSLIGIAPSAEGVSAEVASDLLHPDDRPAAQRAMAEALRTGEPADAEVRVRDRAGHWRRLLIRGVAQRDESGQPEAILAVALDIGERTAAQRRAQELVARFDLAARTAGIGYWSREGDNERPYWSEQARALHGLPDDAPVPTLKEWLERFVHPDDQAMVRQQFRDWFAGRATQVQSELRIVRTDGQVRHLMTNSLLEGDGAEPLLFGILIDVTERRLADRALRRADERAALAARGAGLGTWELDRQTGAVHWDDQMWRLRGRPPRARAPTPDEMLSFVHPADVDATRRLIGRASTDDEIVEHQFRVVWPDGSVHWLASRSATVRDPDGVAERRIGVNWDVTAARRADAERRDREAAEQANAAKSRFLTRMSHELRTPLNAVLGFTQLLLARTGEATARDWLQHVESAGRHLLTLINDVLDLASLDSGEMRVEPSAVDLAALVGGVLPLVEPLRAERDVAISCDVPPLRLWSDPVRLRQVLLNLLSNALKYNRPQGRVSIAARSEGGLAVLSVEDTGRGMSEAQLGSLFEPFNRLGIEREGIEGTGIGLTIVKALVDRLGGTIDVQSRPGEGSRFELRLPLAAGADPAPETSPPARVAGLPALSARRGLLYIEDNTVNALIVQELMQRRPDIPLLLAGDARSGLAMAREAQPALVLLDMQLPDLDGLQVLMALRADPRTAGIPVIALTAGALDEDRARARAAGVTEYWTKPLDAVAFARAIDAMYGPPPAA